MIPAQAYGCDCCGCGLPPRQTGRGLGIHCQKGLYILFSAYHANAFLFLFLPLLLPAMPACSLPDRQIGLKLLERKILPAYPSVSDLPTAFPVDGQTTLEDILLPPFATCLGQDIPWTFGPSPVCNLLSGLGKHSGVWRERTRDLLPEAEAWHSAVSYLGRHGQPACFLPPGMRTSSTCHPRGRTQTTDSFSPL